MKAKADYLLQNIDKSKTNFSLSSNDYFQTD